MSTSVLQKLKLMQGQYYIILLGTDRLETLFDILQTMIGNDANDNALQLGSRITGTTEIATILAKYPEWGRALRRLKLPALNKSGRLNDQR